jgi:hypothetical protein
MSDLCSINIDFMKIATVLFPKFRNVRCCNLTLPYGVALCQVAGGGDGFKTSRVSVNTCTV